MTALADHRHLYAARQSFFDLFERLTGPFVAYGNLTHMKALGLRREFRLHHLRHEIDTQNGTDDAERICDRISDRRVLAFHYVERCLQRRGACHRSRVYPERVTDLDSVELTETERDQKAGDARNERQQIVFSAGTPHSFKKLPAIQNADAVKKHDQAGQPYGTNDLCFRGEGAESQAHEQNGSHAEREAEDVDLTDQVAQADGKKQRENWLRADDLAGQTNHVNLPRSKPQKAGSAGPATGRT